MARSSKSGLSHGSEKNEVLNDDESDTTLSESLASTEVCSLTLDSNGEPANRQNLADLAGKRRQRSCNATPRFVMLMVLGCTALVGTIAVVGWAGSTQFHKKQASSSEASTILAAAPEPEAPVAAAAPVKKDDDREAEDDVEDKKISEKHSAAAVEAKKAAEDPIDDEDDLDMDKEIEEMESDLVKEEEENDAEMGEAKIDDNDDDKSVEAASELRDTATELSQDAMELRHAFSPTPYDDSQDVTLAAEVSDESTTPSSDSVNDDYETPSIPRDDVEITPIPFDEGDDDDDDGDDDDDMVDEGNDNDDTTPIPSDDVINEIKDEFHRGLTSAPELTESPAVAELKTDIQSVGEKIAMVEEQKSEDSQQEIASVADDINRKMERVAEIEDQVSKVDTLDAKVKQLISDEKAGQRKVAENEQQMKSNIKSLIAASDKMMEGSKIDEKEQKLAKAAKEVSEKQAQLEWKQTVIQKKEEQLSEKDNELKKEEQEVKEIEKKQSQLAKVVAEKEKEAEKMAQAEEKREEREDEREKNENERENVVSQIEKKVEAANIDVIDKEETDFAEKTVKAQDATQTSFAQNDAHGSVLADATRLTKSNGTSSKSNANHFMMSYIRSHHLRRRNRRMRDHVKRDRDPELNYGSHLIDGDIRISKKYVKTQIKRKLRELAELGDYVDVVEEDMAHLGIGEKCTEKAKGTNTNKNDLKEDVTSFGWEDGLVRYIFAPNYTIEERHTILDAMNNLAELVNSGSDNKKCITYTPYDPEKDDGKEYIWFYPGEGCESPVGAPHDDTNRHVSLATACMERGVVQHELIHILGMWHEQSRTDRDKYVDIKFENIEDGICDNFKMYADPIDDALDLPYDLRSIMHYKSTAFSKNGQDTIVPKNGMPPSELGQRTKPTKIDIMKIRLRYNCTAKKDPSEYEKLLQIPLDATNLKKKKNKDLDVEEDMDKDMDEDMDDDMDDEMNAIIDIDHWPQ